MSKRPIRFASLLMMSVGLGMITALVVEKHLGYDVAIYICAGLIIGSTILGHLAARASDA